jgi:Glutamate-cysteine ligase
LFRKEEEQGDQPRWERKTMDDIFNGTNGLCPLVETYMETLVDVDTETMDYVKRVVAFVSQKASGKLCTTATWMRTFIHEHKDYKKVGCLLFSFFFLFATPQLPPRCPLLLHRRRRLLLLGFIDQRIGSVRPLGCRQ